MKALLLIALILLWAYASSDEALAGVPPDLTGLVGAGALALVVAIGAFAIGRWSRG